MSGRGLRGRARASHAEEQAVFLTAAGARVLGLPRRRVPRVHWQHADSGFTAIVAVCVVGGVGRLGLLLPLGEGVASGLG